MVSFIGRVLLIELPLYIHTYICTYMVTLWHTLPVLGLHRGILPSYHTHKLHKAHS